MKLPKKKLVIWLSAIIGTIAIVLSLALGSYYALKKKSVHKQSVHKQWSVVSTNPMPTYSNQNNVNFWKTHPSIYSTSTNANLNTTVFQDYTNLGNLGEDPDNQRVGGPMFGEYIGIAGSNNNPFDYIEAAQDSPVQNMVFAFNLQNIVNQPAYGADHTFTVMQNEGALLSDPYFKQVSGVHYYDTSLDIGFGGDFTYASGSKENYWVMGGNTAMSTRMLEDEIVAFGTHQLDFDIEPPTKAGVSNVDDLMVQVAEVQHDLQRFNYNLGVRWTIMGGQAAEYIQKSLVHNVKNFVVNTMMNGAETWGIISQQLNSDISSIKNDKNPVVQKWCSKMTKLQIAHYLGYTVLWGTDLSTDADAITLGNQFALSQVGYLGYWSLSEDHKPGSSADRDPGHQTAANNKDYEFTNDIFNSYVVNSKWHLPNRNPAAKVTNLHVVFATKNGVGITWNPSLNAVYYKVEDAKGNVLYTTPKTNFTFNNVTQQYTHVNIVPGQSNIFNVVAVGNDGRDSAPTTVTTGTDGNLIDSVPLPYNQGVAYNHRKYWSAIGKYVVYEGKVYKIVSEVQPYSAPPDENKSFELVIPLKTSSLSKEYVAALDKQASANKPFSTILRTFSLNEVVNALDFPQINQFLYIRLAEKMTM